MTDPRRVLTMLACALLMVVASCGDEDGTQGDTPEPEQGPAMSASEFWSLIQEVHSEVPYDWEKKEALLTQRLQGLSTERLRGYGHHWDAAMKEAYDWRLWAAAYVIHGGCSDDGFSDFRSTIIMLGEETFRRAMRDPDSLLAAAKAAKGDLRHENFGYPVNSVWREKTGEDFMPPAFPIPSGTEPSGESWEEDDLPRIVPALWKAYGE